MKQTSQIRQLQPRKCNKRHRLHSARRRPVLEILEDRTLPSVTLTGIPDWTEQGPGPAINNTNVTNLGQNNAVSGAVEAIAVHPNNNTIYVATVNGGVWRTDNASFSTFDGINNDGDGSTDEADELPTWRPLTDTQASLATSAIALSPLDANTIFVGTGTFSAAARDGGQPIGLLRSTDGGTTWQNLGRTNFGGERVRSVVPTAITTASGQVVMAATIDGGALYRSIDGGQTWNTISGSPGATDGVDNDADGATDEPGELNLPNGDVSHLVADPGNNSRFYAAIAGRTLTGGFNVAAGVAGVFRSDDGGVTWQKVSTGIPQGTLDAAGRMELSVSAAGANPVHAAILNPGPNDNLQAVFRTTNQGGMWRQIQNLQQTNPANQGTIHFSILSDPGNANVFYIGGDRINNNPFSGNLFRVTANDATPANDNWAAIVDGGANNTAPHADSRDMVIVNGHLIEVNDGGVVRLRNPGNVATRRWESMNGNIRPTEIRTIGLNSRNNNNANDDRIGIGTQDTGSSSRVIGTGGNAAANPFNSTIGGDGVKAEADDLSDTIYFSSQRFQTFRQQVGGGGAANVARALNGAPGHNVLHIRDSNGDGIQDGVDTFPFTVEFATNAVAANRLLLGSTARLYESTDGGASFNSLGGLANGTADGIDNDVNGVADDAGEMIPSPVAGLTGTVTAIAYGGTRNAVNNANVAYVGTNTGNIFLRTMAGNVFNPTNYNAQTDGDTPLEIVLDPTDWQVAYVVETTDVWMTSDMGNNWQRITGNLGAIANLNSGFNVPGSLLNTVDLVKAASSDVVLAGGLAGVFRAVPNGASTVWTEFGVGLPNADVRDVEYNPTSDVFIAGTLGRGAWTISAVSQVIEVAGVVTVCGDEDHINQDDTIRLVRNAANTGMLDIFINNTTNTPDASVPLAAVTQINVFTAGGNDTLIVDSTNGLINVPNGIRYDGDNPCPGQVGAGVGGFDTLELQQTGGPTHTSATYSVGSTPGSGTHTIVGAGMGNVQTVFFENLAPVVDVVPSLVLNVNATPANNAINYTTGSLITQGEVTIDTQEPIEFSNKGTLVINALAGSDTVNLNNPFAPTGLGAITVNGNDDTAGDSLIVNGVAATTTVNTATATISGASGGSVFINQSPACLGG